MSTSDQGSSRSSAADTVAELSADIASFFDANGPRHLRK